MLLRLKGLILSFFTMTIFLSGFNPEAAFAKPVQDSPSPAGFSLLPKRTISTSKMGINAFVNDQRFGSIRNQFREVKGTLGIKNVRVLFAWNDQVQPSPNSAINFSFYDDIVTNLPSGVNAMVVLTGIPSWMQNSSNWINGDPRLTFVEKWVKPVLTRYSSKSKVKGWQIWNEPNMLENIDNQTLDMAEKPENYLKLLLLSYQASRAINSRKKVISAATTAINQNFPETINYNEELRNGGAEEYMDVWGIHFYGEHLENVLRPGGVDEYLKTLKKPIWVTESGEKGTLNQKDYGQRVWPFLLKSYPAIKRIYIYQFTEATPADDTYGLKNLTPGRTVSDLYIYFRDRKK